MQGQVLGQPAEIETLSTRGRPRRLKMTMKTRMTTTWMLGEHLLEYLLEVCLLRQVRLWKASSRQVAAELEPAMAWCPAIAPWRSVLRLC